MNEDTNQNTILEESKQIVVDQETPNREEAVDYSSYNIYKKLSLLRLFVQEHINLTGKEKSGTGNEGKPSQFKYIEIDDYNNIYLKNLNKLGLTVLYNYWAGEINIANYVIGYHEAKLINADNFSESLFFKVRAFIDPVDIMKFGGGSIIQIDGAGYTYARRYLDMQILQLAIPDAIESAEDNQKANPNHSFVEKKRYPQPPSSNQNQREIVEQAVKQFNGASVQNTKPLSPAQHNFIKKLVSGGELPSDGYLKFGKKSWEELTSAEASNAIDDGKKQGMKPKADAKDVVSDPATPPDWHSTIAY